nr:outer-membrane channel-forming protein IV {N-terminal} [Aeromonas hydrophila, Ah65, Peptide Partial, 20 aa] [Aeromonas hydrophila]
ADYSGDIHKNDYKRRMQFNV